MIFVSQRFRLTLVSSALIIIGMVAVAPAKSQEIGQGQVRMHDHGQHLRGNEDDTDTHAMPYAGQQHRAIKSLSKDDIAELQKGGGWGMAKAAELNGVPGPAHVLELAEEISLSTAQLIAIEALYKDMKQAAIAEGEKLIAAEAALDRAFRESGLTARMLMVLLQDIAQSTSQLRFIHLSTHLATSEILAPDQIAHYNRLRGYDD